LVGVDTEAASDHAEEESSPSGPMWRVAYTTETSVCCSKNTHNTPVYHTHALLENRAYLKEKHPIISVQYT
jgi:hypothetical protein